MDKNFETFVIYVAFFNLALGICSDRAVQIASLLTKKVKIPDKYSDFADVFSKEKILVLLERTKLNEHTINLEDGKQPPNGPIYNLGPMELEILKTCIETHLKTGFIQPSKSLVGLSILFNKKPDSSLHLCVDY